MSAKERGVLRVAFDAMDMYWKQLHAMNEARPAQGLSYVAVACGSSCAACCTYVVDATSVEAGAIAEHVMTLPAAVRQDIIERTQAYDAEWQRFVKANPEPDRRDDSEESIDQQRIWRARWGIRRIACPLLDLDTYRCRAYEWRPATCRGHHAAYPPPERPLELKIPPDGCFDEPSEVEPYRARPVWQIRDTLTQEFSGMLWEAFRRSGLRTVAGQLGPLLLREGHRRFGWPLKTKRPRQNPRLDSAKPPSMKETA